MKWMREYKTLSELMIRVMNEYNYLYNKQYKYGDEVPISFSEAQVVEEIVRHKDQNMTSLANQLGVTKAAITKTMKKMEKKGLIKRYKQISNNKEIFVEVTPYGEQVYGNYQKYIFDNLFKEVFELFDENDDSYKNFVGQCFYSIDKSFQFIQKDKADE